MIVATAGHIDHGKTLLIRVLTGVDTDRLPEEKRRGISIDLGFAYLPTPQGGLLGFVDVPGHERFVHNMLAGVCGIDCALIVVAADDGVMPQTVEHLQILNLLDLDRGIAVITKVDRVDSARVLQVERQIRSLLSGTRFEGCAILSVSSVSGAGIEQLRKVLIADAQDCHARYRDGQNFRFAIDRSFVRPGSGTVVTGTVFNGEVRVGDRHVISPSGMAVRIRGVQIHGSSVESARAGDRCALNLAQIDADAVSRGDWVLDPAIHAPTECLDVRFTLLATERAPLRHWTQVHLHQATGECMARISMRRGADILPGTTVWAQLMTDRPIAVLSGDRFVLRDQCATRTLGGGTVIDPFSPRARASTGRQAMLEAMAAGTATAALQAMVQVANQATDRTKFDIRFNVAATKAAETYEAADALLLGRDSPVLIARERAGQIRGAVLGHMEEFHQAHPHEPGMDARTLRQRAAPWLPTEAFGHLLRHLTESQDVVARGALLALPDHDPSSDTTDNEIWQAVLALLLQNGLTPPTVGELARRLSLTAPLVESLLHRRGKTDGLMRVTEDRWYPTATLAALAANAALVARLSSRGLFSAAQYRDAVGISRRLSIEILEHFDTLGITQRVGDLRRMNLNFVPILGPAKPTFRSPPNKKEYGANHAPMRAIENQLRK